MKVGYVFAIQQVGFTYCSSATNVFTPMLSNLLYS